MEWLGFATLITAYGCIFTAVVTGRKGWVLLMGWLIPILAPVSYTHLYFDVGNVIYTGYPEDWIEILDSHIKKIHLSDFRYGQAGMGGFVDLFAGDVDFVKVGESLKRIGYDGWLTLEMLPNYKQFPEVSLFSNRPAVEKIAALAQRQ